MRIAVRAFILIITAFLIGGPRAQAETELKIGTLPIFDTLLLHVAQREGFFAEAGLKVELVAFQGFVEKNAAVQAGELDGHFGEISAVIVQNAAGLPFQVAAVTSHTNPQARMFGLVTSPKFKGEAVGDLKGGALATSKLAIVDFLAEAIFRQEGLADDFMSRKNIQKIPVRLQMLTNGQVDAAVLPEPLLSIAEAAGGRVLVDDRSLNMPLAVVALRKDLADARTVAALQAALSRAARAVNAAPETYRPLLLELRLIPPQLAESFVLPPFDLNLIPGRMPSKELYADYIDWLVRNKALPPDKSQAPVYEDVVWVSPETEK